MEIGKEVEMRKMWLPELYLKATEYLVEPVQFLVRRYLQMNDAARVHLRLHPDAVIDHITPRTKMHPAEKAPPFEQKGWGWEKDYIYEEDGWWARVYTYSQKDGKISQPVLFIDQALPGYDDHIIPCWIEKFPEEEPTDFLLHHIACRVPDIRKAIWEMEKRGVEFVKNEDTRDYQIYSGYDGKLQQIFTMPEFYRGMVRGKKIAGPVFELIQRDTNLPDWDFLPPQASGLMKDSVGKK